MYNVLYSKGLGLSRKCATPVSYYLFDYVNRIMRVLLARMRFFDFTDYEVRCKASNNICGVVFLDVNSSFSCRLAKNFCLNPENLPFHQSAEAYALDRSVSPFTLK